MTNILNRLTFKYLFITLVVVLLFQVYFLLSTSKIRVTSSESAIIPILENNGDITTNSIERKLTTTTSHHGGGGGESTTLENDPRNSRNNMRTYYKRGVEKSKPSKYTKDEEDLIKKQSLEERTKLDQWIIDEYYNETHMIDSLPHEYKYASVPYYIGDYLNRTGENWTTEYTSNTAWKLDPKLNPLLLPYPHIFIHIPKTGGSSLGSIVKRNYNKGHFQHHWAHPKVDVLKDIVKLDGIFGHIKYGLHFYFEKENNTRVPVLESNLNKYSYMTMLREPVDRVISHYYYHRQNRKDPGHALAMKNSLKEWLAASPAANNDQARMICGFGYDFNGNNITEELAEHHLRYTYKYVGLTERFPESIVMLSHYTGYQSIRYTKINSGRQRVSVSEIPQDIIDEIKERNQIDIKLYAIAKEIFELEIDKIGRDLFNVEVEEFKHKIGGAFKKSTTTNTPPIVQKS
ncbi:putative cell number regulator [Tieghemostelium lacteum]|uniref:Putative cell number regulator n=1 Tax=Tieghemostelium lacteum TaxID=361077 RepID=A0A151ZFP3_TIELA|nr:putative cell number regulator [Tieghemostelium lacteum]|eukprot:KYQ92747.1 putative cell number regulator [Tieghemostelium lacteum]